MMKGVQSSCNGCKEPDFVKCIHCTASKARSSDRYRCNGLSFALLDRGKTPSRERIAPLAVPVLLLTVLTFFAELTARPPAHGG
jgi:hypothetical protein